MVRILSAFVILGAVIGLVFVGIYGVYAHNASFLSSAFFGSLAEHAATFALALAVLPTTVDFALGFFGIWENTHWSRFLTALLAGAGAAFYIVPGLVDLGLARVRRPEGFSPAGI